MSAMSETKVLSRNERFVLGIIMLIKYAMISLGIGSGVYTLTSISSRTTGFNFLGITLISVGLMFLILLCVDCAFDHSLNKRVLITESLLCGVPLYLLMTALGIFALAVSVPGTGRSIPGRAYKEYHLSSYSKWMQNKVSDASHWEKYYKRALVKHHVCSDMTTIYKVDTFDEFHQRPLNAFEAGCCKPPEDCNFNYTSPTIWIRPESNNFSNVDCQTWSNNPTVMCFNCQSCKAAFAQDVKHIWVYVGLIIVIVVAKQVLLILLFALCYCYYPAWERAIS